MNKIKLIVCCLAILREPGHIALNIRILYEPGMSENDDSLLTGNGIQLPIKISNRRDGFETQISEGVIFTGFVSVPVILLQKLHFVGRKVIGLGF